MPEDASDYLSSVNKVLAVCKDVEQGFRGAANTVKNPSLRSLFEQLSSERAGFANGLRAAVTNAGLKPEDSSGVLGSLHHGWIALKGVLSGHSEHQILEETERGEDFSINRYRDALSHQLPAALRSLLDAQYQRVQQAHNRIKELRDASANGGNAVA